MVGISGLLTIHVTFHVLIQVDPIGMMLEALLGRTESESMA